MTEKVPTTNIVVRVACAKHSANLTLEIGVAEMSNITQGKKIGTYTGRVAVRSTGSFNLTTKQGIIQGINHKYCTKIHKKDGYLYAT